MVIQKYNLVIIDDNVIINFKYMYTAIKFLILFFFYSISFVQENNISYKSNIRIDQKSE